MAKANVVSLVLVADDETGFGILDDVLIPFVYGVAFVRDHPPTFDMSRFKPKFQGGGQNVRDKGLKGYPEAFKKWLHQNEKDPKEPDWEPSEIPNKYKEWLKQGSPDPRNKY